MSTSPSGPPINPYPQPQPVPAARVDTLLGISKTTFNGWLALIIGTAGPLAAYLATVHSPRAAVASGIVTLVASIARVWVGIIQSDAPATPINLSSKVPSIILLACLSGVVALTASGCAHKAQTLPPWAATAPEANIGGTLAAANYVVTGYQHDQAVCAANPKLVQCPALPGMKSTMQKIQQALAIAQPLFATWEAALKTQPSTPAPAQLTQQVNTINSALGTMPAGK